MDELRDRELEIVKLVATGASNKEIAGHLKISTNTVKVHLRNIFGKTGVNSRTELVIWAVKHDLVPNFGLLPPTLEPEDIEDAKDEEIGEQTYGTERTVRLLVGLVALLAFLIAIGLIWMYRSSGAPVDAESDPAPANAKWVDLAPMNTPRFGFALVAYEDQLYTIGGESTQGVTGIVERYDPQSDRWKSVAPKPTAVTDIGAVVIAGKIYIPGGRNANGDVIDLCEMYDPALNEWSACPRLPVRRSSYGITALDGIIYLFGGWDGAQVADTVFRYRPDQAGWEELPRMPTARRNLGAAAAGRKILVVGGEDLDGPLPSNEIFYPDQSDNSRSAWTSGPPLPEPVTEIGITTVADTVYVLGGVGEGALRFPFISFDDAKQWRVINTYTGEIPVKHGIIGLGKYLYLIGGKTNGGLTERNARYQVIFTVSFPIIIQ